MLAKEPNELDRCCVSAGACRRDKNLLSSGGSPDLFLTFVLEGSSPPFKTKPKKKSLDPVWHEQFMEHLVKNDEACVHVQTGMRQGSTLP